MKVIREAALAHVYHLDSDHKVRATCTRYGNVNAARLTKAERMITIKCALCKQKIYRYRKIGKGRLLHCWKGRIVKDYGIHDGDKVKCSCGNLIGIDEGKWVKMKQHSFIFSGHKE